jgi:very-short-patch-repair endonuclease
MPADGPISPAGADNSARRRGSSARWDAEIARIAGLQHGVVSLDQLRSLGVGRKTAHERVRCGVLHVVHEGVFAVGHPQLTREGGYLAAALACGPAALLSHRSAAVLWGLLEQRKHGQDIDVMAPNRRGRTPVGIASHRIGSLCNADRTVLRGIPCTNVPRTLLDLAAVVHPALLRRAVAEAEVLRIVDLAGVRELIRRNRGRRGVARLRLLVDRLDPQTSKTRSELERRFLALCNRAKLPRPEVNATLHVGTMLYRPDFLWRDARLVIEADSRKFHDTFSAFDSDRRREQDLMREGWRVCRCTWAQVEHEPHDLIATIRTLLAGKISADGPISPAGADNLARRRGG